MQLGQLSLCLSSVFVGLDIINLFKDSMKLEKNRIYSMATNTQDTEK